MYIFYIMRILTLIFHPIPSILAFHWQVGEPLLGQLQEVIEAAAPAGLLWRPSQQPELSGGLGSALKKGRCACICTCLPPGILFRWACRGMAMPAQAFCIVGCMQRLRRQCL